MIVDDVEAPGDRRIVVELGVVRPPPVVVALDEELQVLAGRDVDLAGEDVLVAVVEGLGDRLGLGVVEPPLVVLLGDRHAHLVGDIQGVFAAEADHAVGAVALGGAGLEVFHREGQETFRRVHRSVDDQPARAHLVAHIAVQMVAGIGVAAGGERAVQVVGEVPGDDVDGAGHALGAVEQRLGSFDHLDALDHAGRQGVQWRRAAAIEAVVQPHPVLEPQHVLGARALQRDADIVERPVLGRDIEARHRGLQRLDDVNGLGVLDRGGVDDVDTDALLGQLDRKFLLEPAGDHHVLDLGGAGVLRAGLGQGRSAHGQSRRHGGARKESRPHLKSPCRPRPTAVASARHTARPAPALRRAVVSAARGPAPDASGPARRRSRR